MQALIDIFGDYVVFECPNRDNILRLCRKVAQVALIRSPLFSFQSITKSMGFFWKKVDAAMFDALYECTKSTPESLIANITSNETTAKDQ